MPTHALTSVPPSSVKLLPGPLVGRVAANRRYMMSLGNEQLLQAFLFEAGRLSLRVQGWEEASHYHWGWEGFACQLRGHFLGHWLSAAARVFTATGDAEPKAKADALVAVLAECQKDNGGEWAGSIPEKYLDWIARGKSVWAPHYTIHKTLMGLIEMHTLAGSGLALEILTKWARWFTRWTGRFAREEMDDILDVETGGMMESWADLYAITGDEEHLELARRYERRMLFDALLAGEDVLTNEHANTTIPEAHGAARMYEVTGDTRYRDIVHAYWECAVTRRDAFCTGGQTSGEIWTPPGVIASRLSDHTQEHCVVYNMMRLADYLLRWTGEATYADYIERNRLNGIMAQQHPRDGVVAYFLPLRAGGRKEWSLPTAGFECCMGTVVQANATHTGGIYYEDDDGLVIAQYVPSSLAWTCNDVPVAVTLTADRQLGPRVYTKGYLASGEPTGRPREDVYRIEVHAERPVEATLRLRVPGWTSGLNSGLKPAVSVVSPTEDSGPQIDSGLQPTAGLLTLRRKWTSDTVRIALPKVLTTCPLPDAPGTVAFLDGPVVLAGLVDEDREIVYDGDGPTSALTPDSEREWSMWLPGYRTTGQPRNFRLVPLHDIVDERYTVHFPTRRK